MAPRTSWHALSGPPGPVRAIEGTKPDTQIRCTGPGGPLKACHDDDDRLPNPKCDCPAGWVDQIMRTCLLYEVCAACYKWIVVGKANRYQSDMLTRIEIDGFKTFERFGLDLQPLTAIVGPNASGKSNLFDALRFLSLLAQHDIRTAMQGLRGEPEELFRQTHTGPSRCISFAVEVLLSR